jgi:predicted extracellular nuclease
VIVVANHFNSKGGDQSADGALQPPARSSETQRVAQATLLHSFAASLLAVDPDAFLVAAGDINDYPYSPALRTLTTGPAGDQPVLTDLVTLLPAPQQYTYVFNGISQVLDHILVTPGLLGGIEYEVLHVNAEFADQASDHDPQLVRLRMPAAPVVPVDTGDTGGTGGTGNVVVTVPPIAVGATGGLAATGAGTGLPLGVAVIMLLTGAALITTGRNRRRV